VSPGQWVAVGWLFALTPAIVGYVLGWWNGRRCLRRALDVATPAAIVTEIRRPLAVAGRLTITCPRCGMTSNHPEDVAQGYCGNCHDWTSPRGYVSEDPWPTTPITMWSPHAAQLADTEREIRQMITAAEERDPYRRRR
jgi:hypothetical protein